MFLKKRKYYFVSYSVKNEINVGFGNMFVSRTFFDPLEIRKTIENQNGFQGVVLLNWIEISKKQFDMQMRR